MLGRAPACTSWLVGLVCCIEDLRRFSCISAYRDLEAGDNQSLKFKWRDRESNPGPLAPKAKSLTPRPPPLPMAPWEAYMYCNSFCTPIFTNLS